MSAPIIEPSRPRRRGLWIGAVAVVAALAAAGVWLFNGGRANDAQAAKKGPGAVAVVTSPVESRDIPVRLKANGSVTAMQSVELRAQVTSTVREVHIREGQNVRQGDLLFSLDSRAEEANLKKALAQVEKDKADLATAERNLDRNRELFRQKFIAQAALDTVQNQVDTLRGQLAIDTAAVEAARVSRAYMEIRAPFSGRTGVINVRAGSLVQPGAASVPLVTIAQIDPITVSFTLPEKELANIQQAVAGGGVKVRATPQDGSAQYDGRVIFVDNAVDTATGTIRLKAEFANPQGRLWPGMYVNVEMSPRLLAAATVVPAQAVQTGPSGRFVFVVGEDRKAVQQPVKLTYIDEGIAVIEGVKPGARVVTEGAQNLRTGTAVAEASQQGEGAAPKKAGKGKGGKEKGA